MPAETTWTIEPTDDGWRWTARLGGFHLTGISETRTQARDDAAEARERLAEMASRRPCLVCLIMPRRRGSATCSDRCAIRFRHVLAIRFPNLGAPV